MSEKNNTQIIGLPRSRTAWLSVALFYGSCAAYHDASNPPGSCDAAEYLRRLNEGEWSDVVDCSSSLVVRHDLIKAADSNIIIIDRDADDARDAFANHIRDPSLVRATWPIIERSFAELRRVFSRRIILEVKFEDLKKIEVIEKIQRAVCDGRGDNIDRYRIERLQKLNIQERKPSWAGD